MRIPVAQAAAEVMKEQNTKVVFGIPGGQTLFLNNALLDADIQFVATRHEGAAGHAADGWGRLTGTPGFCLATTGPGATNLLTPIGGALRDSSPMIALIFQNRLADVGRGDAQEANHEAIFTSLVKEYIPVRHPDAAVWAMREAYRVAMSGRPGPVVVDFYRDVLEEGVCEYEYKDPKSYCFQPIVPPNQENLTKAADFLAKTAKVCILCGNGVKLSHASDKVLKLAEKLNAPMVTTFNGIGSVPTTHPLVYGARTRHGSAFTKSILESADSVLVLGSSMSAVGTNRWGLKLNNIIQVDFDSKNIGRHYPVECGIVGDIGLTIDALLNTLPSASEENKKISSEWVTGIDKDFDAWKKKVYSGSINDSKAVPAPPVAVMRELSELLKEDEIVCIDAGNPGAWSHLLTLKEKVSYMKPVNYGNMAFAVPAGMASSLAEPGREVISILGDGSMGMCLGELESVARSGSKQIVIVLNDGAYGNIRQEENFKFGPRYTGVDLTQLDFAEIAGNAGMGGETIQKAEDLKAAIERAREHKGNYLINILFDGSYSVWPEAF